jgi:carbamoylphosphate synthase large subunit
MRRHHPEASRNTTRDAASQREDELSLAVPMVLHLRLGPDDVDAYGDDLRRGVVHIEIGPRVTEGSSHVDVFWRSVALLCRFFQRKGR